MIAAPFFRSAIVALAALLLTLDVHAATGGVGLVQFALGDVQIVDAGGARRPLKKGDVINEGDSILTGASSSAQVKMSDEGILAIRQNSELKIDSYKFSGKEDGTESAFMSLAKGGFRTITGVIGRTNKSTYEVRTSDATIGIRGTDHEPFFMPAPAPTEPAAAPGTPAPGTYDKVNVGEAFIRNPAGSVNIAANEVGFAAPAQPPTLLPVMPDFFKATPPIQAGGQAEEKGAEVRDTAPADSTAGAPATAAAAAAADAADGLNLGMDAASATSRSVATSERPIEASVEGRNISLTGGDEQLFSPPAPLQFANNARVRHEGVFSVTERNSSNNFTATMRNRITLDNPPGVLFAGPETNTNYLFDGRGTLVRIVETPYVVSDHGTSLPATSSQFAAATPIEHAQVTFGGGGSVAAETYHDAATQTRLGRWRGGSVSIVDLANGNSYVEPLGPRSAHWIVFQRPTSLPVIGRFQYVPTFATAPTDTYGNVGVLNRAFLALNFSGLNVTGGADITIPSGPDGVLGIQNLRSFFSVESIADLQFNESTADGLRIQCFGTGCAPNQTYTGRIRGAITSSTGGAQSGDGAFFRYNFNTNYNDAATAAANNRVNDDYIHGLVAFGQSSAVVPPTPATRDTNVAASYFTGGFTGTHAMHTLSLAARPGNIDCTSGNAPCSGSVRSAVDDDQFEPNPTSFTITSGNVTGFTAANSAQVAPFNTGIFFGRWTNATVTSPQGSGTVLGDFHFIRGPELFPFYLTQAHSGSATYNFDGGAVTDHLGTTGTFASGSANRLTVDFNRQAISVFTDVTLPPRGGIQPRNFIARASNIRLDDNDFAANTGPQMQRNMAVWFNTPTTNASNASGRLNGSITSGSGVGALLSFAFDGQDPLNANQHEHANGVAAFVLNSTSATPGLGSMRAYELSLFAMGFQPTPAVNSANEDNRYLIDGRAQSPFRVINSSTSGAPVRFDGQFPIAYATTSPPQNFVDNINTIFSIRAADYTGAFAGAQRASIVEAGRDAETGMRWGRYAGGEVLIFDRISGAAVGTIDATVRSPHFMFSGVQAGPVVLPTTGSATYTLVGNTNPTDNFGNVGTLGSATLTADFAARTVNTSITATVAGNNWAASAANVPIQKDTYFDAVKRLNGTGNLTVTVNGSAANTAGNIIGGFVAPSGKGVGKAFSLHTTSTLPSTGNAITGSSTVSGVAAMKRP